MEYNRDPFTEKDSGLFWPIVIAISAAVVLFMGGVALAHDALPTAGQPLGWSYGWECCSLTDCKRMEAADIKETPEGYLVVRTGEVIPYRDYRIKDSKDEYFHRCAPGADFDNKRSLCLYVPPRLF